AADHQRPERSVASDGEGNREHADLERTQRGARAPIDLNGRGRGVERDLEGARRVPTVLQKKLDLVDAARTDLGRGERHELNSLVLEHRSLAEPLGKDVRVFLGL